MAHPEIPHGAIRVGFTPDEEVGAGTKYFDVAQFGAKYTYTMDGGRRGELETESFSADAMTLAFRGQSLDDAEVFGRHRCHVQVDIAADLALAPLSRVRRTLSRISSFQLGSPCSTAADIWLTTAGVGARRIVPSMRLRC